MKVNVALLQKIHSFGQGIINFAEKRTPRFRRVEVKRTNSEESNVQYIPERRNFGVFDNGYNDTLMYCDDLDRELRTDGRLRRDLIWCFQNRDKTPALLESEIKLDRKIIRRGDRYDEIQLTEHGSEYPGILKVTRPYSDTVCLHAIKESKIYQYIASLSEEELRRAHVDQIHIVRVATLSGFYLIDERNKTIMPIGCVG